MEELRRVEVNRDGTWIRVRLCEVKAGERFRMFEPEGDPVKDGIGLTEWVAKEDGYTRDDGVGGIEVVETG